MTCITGLTLAQKEKHYLQDDDRKFMKIYTPQKNAHQPYFFKIGDRRYLLYCGGGEQLTAKYGISTYKYMPWQLYVGEWDAGNILNIERIETGMSVHSIHCSPYAQYVNQEIHFSYIGAQMNSYDVMAYRLYTAHGENFNSLSLAIAAHDESVFAGFENQGWQFLSWQEQECEFINKQTRQNATFYPEEFDSVLRILPVDHDPDLIMITGRKDNLFKTFVYDIKSLRAIAEVTAHGESVYKSTLTDDGFVIHAKRMGDFEERELHVARLELQPV